MVVFSGGEAIKEFFAEFDEWLSEPVGVYVLGGSAMTIHGLKDQTEDIDLALAVTIEFEHAHHALQQHGFEVIDEPTESFDSVGKTVELRHQDRGFRVDLFERQVVGKVWITDRMHNRAASMFGYGCGCQIAESQALTWSVQPVKNKILTAEFRVSSDQQILLAVLTEHQ